MKAEEPDSVTAERCVSLRKKSKQGQRISDDESDFVYSCWKKWPKWYSITEQRVYEETRPFGANAGDIPSD